MTNTYDTSNEPLGSTAPKVLFNNASNFDEAMNSTAPSFDDRFGVRRQTWAGAEYEWQQMLQNSGYEPVHLVYVDGSALVVSRPSQLIDRAGLSYRIKLPVPGGFPVTLTGTWATDQALLLEVTDSTIRQELSSSTGATLVGTTRGDGTTTTVETRLDELENRSAKLLHTAAEIVAAFPDGGTLRIANGTHNIAAPLTIDYSTPTSGGVATSFTGYVSKRYSIRGESWANSILVSTAADFTVKLLGSYPVTQNFHGDDSLQDLTITNPVRNVPNTTNSGASGVLVQTKAYTNIKRYTAKNLKLGLQLTGVLTSKLEDIEIDGCYQGIFANNTLGVSGPNSMIWSKVKVGGATSNAIVADVGAASHFDTITVEGNGTHGSASCGMVLNIPADQLAPVIKLTNPYFELNKGAADIYIDNLGTHPATVIIEGGTFTRAGAEYVNVNIQAHSTGGGQVTVLLQGCHFLSVSGYIPSNARPFWKADSAACRVIADEFCTFNETTSLVGARKYSMVQAFVTNAAGAIIGGDSTQLTPTKLGTGVYQFDSQGFFGLTALDYSVTANICDSAATGVSAATKIKVQPVNGGRFVVNCFNDAGVATDSPLSVQVASLRYSV